jgi:GH15 family glucan-1,4-alpha-glucosidase
MRPACGDVPRYGNQQEAGGTVAGRIEDYAIIGDMQTALVCSDGSIDWLCLPRFDAGACFAALLGSEQNGFWRIAPSGPGETPPERVMSRAGGIPAVHGGEDVNSADW